MTGLMQLVAYGAQDIYLTGNPMITYFKVVYRRHTNFAMESIEQTFNGNVGFGNKVEATISRNGDLVNGIYLQATLPNIVESSTISGSELRWVDDVGHHLIEEVDVEIGGQRIDRHYGDWLEIWAQLTVPAGKMLGYREMIGQDPLDAIGQLTGLQSDLVNPTSEAAQGSISGVYALASSTIPGRTIYVPLQFWFCRNVGLALPLIALQYHEVKIKLTFKARNKLILNDTYLGTTPNALIASLWVDYIYLDTDERRRFAQVSHEYLIEQLQKYEETGTSSSTSTTTVAVKPNFNHPVKELIWVVQYDNFVNLRHNQWSNFTTSVAEYSTSGTPVLINNISDFNPSYEQTTFNPGYIASDSLSPYTNLPTTGKRSTRPHQARNPVFSAQLKLNGND